ncbi:MAG: MBL fold metallo-hydrolase [Clostridiales bacterium]|jgi:glyoxylase-like metal-dependent hydrolase (beta-lactamase superfamily II)|nr:MBL fold metallo-hydrolase [Clostridiales bacterium]
MEKVIFHHLKVGHLGTNCYVFGDAVSREVIVIDPGGRAGEIRDLLDAEKVQVTAIVNTHGHFDHVGANKRLHKMTGAPIWIHQADTHLPKSGLVGFLGEIAKYEKAQSYLVDGQEIQLGSLIIKVLHTPGHTPGGICLYCGNYLFSGDTLFRLSIGRTDLPGGSSTALLSSIKEKLLILPEAVQVFPGHGSFTTIGEEKRKNPYLRN